MSKSILVNKNSKINVKIYVAYDETQEALVAATDKKELKKYQDVEEYEVIFKKPNHKDDVDISKKCLKTSSQGVNFSFSLDVVNYRQERFKQLIQSWNFRDEEGNLLPANQETLFQMEPVLANAILQAITDKAPLNM